MTNISVSPQAIKAFEKATKDLLSELEASQLNTNALDHISLHVSFKHMTASYKVDISYDELEKVKSVRATEWCWSLKVAIEALNEQTS
jgi:hypothetical protein